MRRGRYDPLTWLNRRNPGPWICSYRRAYGRNQPRPAKVAPRGRYSWQEESQRELNRWLVQRYQRTWRKMKGA